MPHKTRDFSAIQKKLILSLQALIDKPNELQFDQCERLKRVIGKLETREIPEKERQDYWNVFTYICLLPTQIPEIMRHEQSKKLLDLLDHCQGQVTQLKTQKAKKC